MIRAGRSGLRVLPDGYEIVADPRAIRVRRIMAGDVPSPETIQVKWKSRGRFGADGRFRTSRIRPSTFPYHLCIRGLRRLQVFDARAIRPPVELRTPRAADRIVLQDSSGRKKVSDLLSEEGVPRELRDRQPVLVDREGVLWVIGIQRAGRARVDADTSTLWCVHWKGSLPIDAAIRGGRSRD